VDHVTDPLLLRNLVATRMKPGTSDSVAGNSDQSSQLQIQRSVVYFTVLYFTLLYSTLLYFTLLYFTLLYCTLRYSTLLYFTVLYCSLLYFALLYCMLLYFIVLFFTLLYFIYYLQANDADLTSSNGDEKMNVNSTWPVSTTYVCGVDSKIFSRHEVTLDRVTVTERNY
jgi:hypothetical protein